MPTALDLITSSLRLVNVVAAGEPVPTDMANDSLQVLNDMIDSWNAQRLNIYTTRIDDYALVANQASYTLGPAGNFNAPRPAQIDGMSSILMFNPANPVEVPITMFTVDQWQTQVPLKTVSGTFPIIVYDDGGFPLRTLYMWPIPTTSIHKLRIYSWQALAAQTLAGSVSFPPGYAQAFRYNLACLLAAEFAAPIRADVVQIARESLGVVKRMNMPDLNMKSDLLPDPAGWNYKAIEFGIAW